MSDFCFYKRFLSYYPKTAILHLCSINRHSGHDGWSAGSSDINFKGNQPPKDDSGQIWFKLAQWFPRRRFFKKFTDGRQVMAIAHMTFGSGELKNDSIFVTDCLFTSPSSKPFTRFES
jgi:hypothetical protein